MGFEPKHVHLVEPVDSIAGLHPVPSALHCVASYPCFYPAGYAFDVVFPLVNVRQAEFWSINGAAAGGWALVAITWIMTILGWVGATFLVAGLTSLAGDGRRLKAAFKLRRKPIPARSCRHR
jgi:hypothetical protein